MRKLMKLLLIFIAFIIGLSIIGNIIGPSDGRKETPRARPIGPNPKTVELIITRHAAMSWLYALADPNDKTPPDRIADQLRYECDVAGTSVCVMLVWKNIHEAPTTMPMTDKQADDQYLSYTRNLNTHFEELLVSNGKGGMDDYPIINSTR